jgi:signal transduction histidine kinase
MARRVQGYQTALQDYLREVTQAQEEERARLGRELHDETVQTLIALGHKAQRVQRNFERSDGQTGDNIIELRGMIAQAIEEVRRLSQALHPLYLEELGLIAALETLAREVGAQFTVSGYPHRLSAEKELAFYRIAQEALNNARRHARANTIQVEVKFERDTTTLQVSDDGVGFEPQPQFNVLTGTGHFGLMGMRERSQLIAGQLAIQSTPGMGTRIVLVVPV